MAFEYDLTYSGRTLVRLEQQTTVGLGKVSPRLRFGFNAKTLAHGVNGTLLSLQMDVSFKNELIGSGGLRESGQSVRAHGGSVTIDVPLSPQALTFLREGVRDNDLDLNLEFNGLVQVEGDLATLNLAGMEGSPLQVSRQGSLLLVPHSEWVKKILEPLSSGSYLMLTLHVPPPPADGVWKAALTHLSAAENLYNDGQDEAVLQRCYSVFESLAGAPKNIFDGVADPQKRAHVNELLRYSKEYMHAGRHVGKGASLDGEFDVSHRDSSFALALTKTWLTYISRLLSAG